MKLQTIKNVSKKGFTLIELLVVITIIGILATGATSTYTTQIQKARDTTRINDVKALQSAVEQVYQDAMEYPSKYQSATDGGSANDADAIAYFEAVGDYLDKYPSDSKIGKPGNISGDDTKQGGSSITNSTHLGYTYEVGDDENSIDKGNFEISTGFEATGNITGKAQVDSLGSENRDSNRLEVGTASKTLGLDTAMTAADTSAACKITTAGCTN